MTTFRDAIYDAAWVQIEANGYFDRECANAVLAMPEMQAIRRVLRFDFDGWCCDDCRDAHLADLDLPEHVIDWVLGTDA